MKLWTYFKEHKGFARMLEGLKNKYVSLGRYSGIVELDNLTSLEAEELSRFFGQRLVEGQTFRISFGKVERRLKNTIYEDFTWEELFTNYFGTHPVSKNEVKRLAQEEEIAFFEGVTSGLSDELRKFVLEVVQAKDSLYQVIIKRYHREAKVFRTELGNILDIVDNLEKLVPTTLPVLAATSGNPHFLDMNGQNSSLFIKLLAKYRGYEEPKTNQERIAFLAEFGIGVDDLSNYVITYLLGSSSSFVDEFKKAREPLNLNLHNLSKIDDLSADAKKVFVFENPSILSKLMHLDVPILITSGIPNYAVYKVLDKLVESGTRIYYNGDFDPEGLTIANNLKKRYPLLSLFCYDEEDYRKTMSRDNTLNDSRIKKLNNVDCENLSTIKALLTKERKCGYQENNIDRITLFIENERQ